MSPIDRKSRFNELPHFLCIGAQKAGTSWLHSNLRGHPEVWFPPIKELHYFDHRFIERHRKWTTKHIQRNVGRLINIHTAKVDPPNLAYLHYLTSIGTQNLFSEDWYRLVFRRPGGREKLRGEVTPTYSMIPDKGVAYLRKFLGGVKIIYLIRHPVTRAMSHIRMNLDRKFGNRLQEEIAGWPRERWSRIVNRVEVLARGRYSEFVPTWDRHFAAGEILYLPYGLISKTPLELLREVEKFLDLPAHDDYAKARKQIHATRKVSLPDFVAGELEDLLAHEVTFLRNRFGTDFLATI